MPSVVEKNKGLGGVTSRAIRAVNKRGKLRKAVDRGLMTETDRKARERMTQNKAKPNGSTRP
jgi:hypothetical protein